MLAPLSTSDRLVALGRAPEISAHSTFGGNDRLRKLRSPASLWAAVVCVVVTMAGCGNEGRTGESDDGFCGGGEIRRTLVTQSSVGTVYLAEANNADDSMDKQGSSGPVTDVRTVVLSVSGPQCFSSWCSEQLDSTCTITAVYPDRVEIEADFRTNERSCANGPTTCTGDCRQAIAVCGEIVLSGDTITIDEPDSDLFVVPTSVALPFDSRRGEDVNVPRE